MSLSQKSRTALYQGLIGVVHDDEAVEELLSYFPSRDLDEPATKEFVRAQIADVRVEIAGVRTDLAAEASSLRTELAAEASSLRTEIAALRAEMHQGFQRMTLALAGLMVSMTGVTVAAVTLTH